MTPASRPNNIELVRLFSTPTEMEASILVASLAEYGVTATATGGFTAGFLAEAPGSVQIMTPQSELEAARLALDSIRRENAEINWNAIDVGQPED